MASEYTLKKDATLMDVLRKIQENDAKLGVILNDDGTVYSVFTDGDIRRAILLGLELNALALDSGSKNFVCCEIGTPLPLMKEIALKNKVVQLIILNENKTFNNVFTVNHLANDNSKIPVIIMAGGIGSRLAPITETIPKPMVEINGKPMLQHIIKKLQEEGFKDLHISVNYKKEQIIDHFGNGEVMNVNIQYIEEEKKLGTAGSLALANLPKGHEICLVLNGDVLTNFSYSALISDHLTFNPLATMAVREHKIKNPFGVIEHTNGIITGVTEKPEYFSLVNAGIYVISEVAISHIFDNQYLDMPELFEILQAKEKSSTRVFPIVENWFDVGRMSDLNFVRTNDSWAKNIIFDNSTTKSKE